MSGKLSDKVYEALRDEIDAGKIKDMEFLNENQLAERFSVSKGPVKDALHILCKQGYLVSYPRKGYMVSHFTTEQINKMQLIRRKIEELSVEGAIVKASDDDIHSLYLYTQTQEMSKDPEKFNNTKFHLRLAEISGNEFIPEILAPLLHKASRIMGGEELDFTKHIAIIEALLSRDVNKAVQAIRADIITL